ncbi:hypothetical protein [Herpetosiphon sp.]|uniref:Kelch repeat-containing protein n=1 Tax=Herpetosiphon aurantiacus (strain ATCC 23779 / DSM 785 / 114-95) TaxID=316274 RepID=A9AUY7_HERA2|nr:hypothetical protein [Herpetosiphon sp.]ABX06575.1 hypothetical protein Haur_3941 [Herpetosiphon aurantiacus DSM 785]
MVRNRKRRRVLSSFLITLTLLVTFISSVSAISLNATVSLSSGDFASGYFGLTGLTQQDQVIGDVTYGGVQLIPQGALAQWSDASNQLCRTLADMGTVSFKQHLYAIGGSTASSGNVAVVSEVCRATVTDTGGETTEWTELPQTLPVPLTRMSTVVVTNTSDPTKGIMYTFGGQSASTGDIEYTDKIYSNVINADGSLNTWQTQALTTGEKLINTTATAYTTPNGQTYIYLIGGKTRDTSALFSPIYVRRSVRRTLVGPNGVLGPWQSMPDLPITPDMFTPTNGCDENVGLHSMDVANFDAITLTSTYRAFLVVGGTFELGTGHVAVGCTRTVEGSAQAMLGKLDTNGMLTWETQRYILPEPLSSPRVIGVNQKIYVVGGRQGSAGDPTHRIYTSYINIDNFTLPVFGQSNFRVSENALLTSQARSGHGLELIYINFRPVAYMYGGIRVGNTYQQDVLFGFVGTDADIDLTVGGYPSPGVYRSSPLQLRAPAIIEQMLWDATLPNPPINTDIQMQYKLAATRGALETAQWQTVDASPGNDNYSVQGPNVANGTPAVQGQWFQYQALMTTQSPTEVGATPILRNVRIKYKVDGHPSLYVDSATMSTVSTTGITAFTATFKNGIKPGSNDTENVLDADIESQGTFFVDMYLLPPGSADVPPARDPDSGAYPLGMVFTEINRLNLPQDGEFTLDAISDNTIWRRTCPAATVDCPLVVWQALFNKTGTWKVYLVIDSGNYVTEAETPAGQRELDNVYSFNVNSTVVGSTIHMPVVGINFLATPPQP